MTNNIYDLYTESKGRNNDTEAFFFARNERSVTIGDGEVLDIKQEESSQLALRILRHGRIGFCSSSGIYNFKQMVSDAIEVSEVGDAAAFSLTSDAGYSNVKVFSEKIYNADIPDILNMAREYTNILSGLSYNLHYKFRLTVLSDLIKIILDDGKEKEYKKSIISLNFDGKLINKEKQLILSFKESSCDLLDAAVVAKAYIKDKIDRHIFNDNIDWKGKCDVLLTPNAVYGIFRNILAMTFNGKRAAAGILIKRKFDKDLNIFDDGTVDWKIGSQPFDDEGVSAKRTPLVLEGEAVNFVYDKMTGYICNTASTGNGKRAWGVPPAPVSNNIVILGNRRDTRDNIIHNIKKGILVDCVINDGRSQPTNGIFSGYILRGYCIKDGKLLAGTKDKKIYINIDEAFNSIVCFADDHSWVAGEMYTPSIWLKNIDIF